VYHWSIEDNTEEKKWPRMTMREGIANEKDFGSTTNGKHEELYSHGFICTRKQISPD